MSRPAAAAASASSASAPSAADIPDGDEGAPSAEEGVERAGEWSPGPAAADGSGLALGLGLHAAAAAVDPSECSSPPSPPRLGVSAGTWLHTRADGSLQQLSADNYYGQRDARGLPHGRGIRLTPLGAIICRQCGQWADGQNQIQH